MKEEMGMWMGTEDDKEGDTRYGMTTKRNDERVMANV